MAAVTSCANALYTSKVVSGLSATVSGKKVVYAMFLCHHVLTLNTIRTRG